MTESSFKGGLRESLKNKRRDRGLESASALSMLDWNLDADRSTVLRPQAARTEAFFFELSPRAAQTALVMPACTNDASDSLRGQAQDNPLSRREFLSATTLVLGAALVGCKSAPGTATEEPIIDIHQHVSYSGRPDDVLLAHQRAMGVTKTILLPAGRPVSSPSTHDGLSNGLQAKCAGNLACYEFAHSHRRHYRFAANEVPDLEIALEEIRTYLELGGLMIAEQKFGVDSDSTAMQRIYQLAADYKVPVLMHWQEGMYNYGFERFYKLLEKYPRTTFIGHAQTWWAHIDKNCEPTVMYPKGKVTPGGLTDRYLSDYPNMYGDLSAGSGLNALTRDEEFARDFLKRHERKLLYGSDCSDWVGTGTACQGAQTIAVVRRLAPSKQTERRLLYENAHKLFRI